MKAIYASKLYKGSKRKDKIRSALSDPLNAELVTQLRSYLDKDELSKIDDDKDERPEEPDVDEKDSENRGASMKPSGNSSGTSGYTGGSGSDDSLLDTIKDDDLGTMPDNSDQQSGEEVSDNDQSKDDVSESVEISGVDSTEVVDNEFKVSDIQKELNSTSTTDGVRRVSTKGSEIWIYYNDDVNLNNIMEPVISKLDKLDDKLVEFNRLARTENAIVFQIDGDKS